MKTCESERKGSRTRVLADFNKQEQRKSTKKQKDFDQSRPQKRSKTHLRRGPSSWKRKATISRPWRRICRSEISSSIAGVEKLEEPDKSISFGSWCLERRRQGFSCCAESAFYRERVVSRVFDESMDILWLRVQISGIWRIRFRTSGSRVDHGRVTGVVELLCPSSLSYITKPASQGMGRQPIGT